MTQPRDDWYNRCYSSFIYLPEKFRLELDRLAQPVLSTEVKCLDHYLLQEGTKIGVTDKESTEYLRSHCTPMPNRFKTLNDSDDLFAKVPHTNAAMRNSLKACNTLRCLTLFKDSQDDLKIPVDYDSHLSILKIICDEEITNWNEFYM